VQLARPSHIPVINGLSDLRHPCQVLSDCFTVYERRGRLDDVHVAYLGDGNNMANSWIEAAGLFGLELALATPEGYRPDPHVLAAARSRGARITIGADPREAARGAHVISTDVWASMGQEEEAEARRRAFAGYCVDAALLATAAPDAIVLHCLPAHRGEEITGDVLDGPQSAAWQQAENRLHVQKALLERLVVP
jgi:ornithine carbamoyltransferase